MPDSSSPPVRADARVADVMARWPMTVEVFLRRRMACPGCPMAPFITVAEAAASYGIDPRDLTADLHAAVLSAGSDDQP